MDTALKPNQTDPRQVLSARADEELAHAQEQIARVGEEMARAERQLSKLERGTARPAVRRKRTLFDRPAVRGFTGLLLAACIGAFAIVRQSSHGDVAKEMTPQRVAASSPLLANPERSAESNLSAVQAAPSQPAAPAQLTPDDIALTAAALSPAMTQLLQSMARDLASLGQGLEQLKASQEQMARDNAITTQQLKASQENIARLIAKASEAKASEAKASEAKASEAKASEAKASEAKASETKASEVRPSGQSQRPRISTPPPRATPAPTLGPR